MWRSHIRLQLSVRKFPRSVCVNFLRKPCLSISTFSVKNPNPLHLVNSSINLSSRQSLDTPHRPKITTTRVFQPCQICPAPPSCPSTSKRDLFCCAACHHHSQLGSTTIHQTIGLPLPCRTSIIEHHFAPKLTEAGYTQTTSRQGRTTHRRCPPTAIIKHPKYKLSTSWKLHCCRNVSPGPPSIRKPKLHAEEPALLNTTTIEKGRP